MTLHAALIVGLFGVLAVAGGGALTTWVFRLVDNQSRAASIAPSRADADVPLSEGLAVPGESVDVESAGEILRGGAWIGALERIAIYAALVGGWKEATAMVLALKALGRYPELRNDNCSAVAERFIIGTFVSVLWACACALLAIWLR